MVNPPSLVQEPPTPPDAARDGVANALGPLLPRLWRFALALTYDRAAAEDLVQSTCLRAIERADRFRPGTALDRWTFTLMVNIHRDARRRHARAPFVPVEPPDAIDPSPTPEDDCAHADVLRAIDALPNDQRAAVALVMGEGLTYREAAQVLGVPVGTVMSRIHAARRTLHEVLAR